MSTLERIKQLRKQRNQLLRKLLAFRLMIPGAYKEVYRKCGRQNCWCYEKAGHLLRRITWSEQGLSKSKAIPEHDVPWIKSATNSYRDFRSKRREILQLEKTLKELLDVYEKEIVKKSRQQRDYL
ncbi:MAG: hypothetical protein QF442_03490 [Candidatus Peribacteraceae bacterium]|jgi:hypothetical protein|nr:hypothetical protein [Candidatus Peribacteraceae bacterium]